MFYIMYNFLWVLFSWLLWITCWLEWMIEWFMPIYYLTITSLSLIELRWIILELKSRGLFKNLHLHHLLLRVCWISDSLFYLFPFFSSESEKIKLADKCFIELCNFLWVRFSWLLWITCWSEWFNILLFYSFVFFVFCFVFCDFYFLFFFALFVV